MELLTAPASVLLARVYRPVIVHHYRLYWVSLDLTDREHFVSANCPVILDLSGEPIGTGYRSTHRQRPAGSYSQRCAAHR